MPLDYEIRDDASVYECLRRSNVVINLIGAPWDTKNFSIDETNHVIPGRIAKVCVALLRNTLQAHEGTARCRGWCRAHDPCFRAWCQQGLSVGVW